MRNRIRWTTQRIVAMLLIMLCVFTLCPVNTIAAYDVSQRETIRVGFFAMDDYHMIDEEDKGNYKGYGYDVLALMNRYWDVKYEFVGYDKTWDDMLKMLDNGEIDMLSPVAKTPEREEKYGFSRSIGNSKTVIVVRNDNSTFHSKDYTTYDGMRVAFLTGSAQNKEFDQFASANKFSYRPVCYDSVSEMKEALQAGEVDALIHTPFGNTPDEKVLDAFNPADFYFVVRKSDAELLSKINNAIDQVNATEGNWQDVLENRYFNKTDNRNLAFTEEEKAVIAQYSSDETALNILCDPTRYPYSYLEDGEWKGILPDYFRMVAEYTGISYHFWMLKDRDDYIEQQSSPELGIILDTRDTGSAWREKTQCLFSVPYITMRMAMVTRRDFDGKINKVATVSQKLVSSLDEAYAKDAEKIIYDTREEAMQAVKKGDADAAFVYQYMAQACVNQDHSGILTYTLLEEPVYEYFLGFGPNVDHRLPGILTKAIYAMPDGTIEDLAAKYTSLQPQELSLMDMLRLNPDILIGAVALLLIVFLLISAILIQKMQSRKKIQLAMQKKAEELAGLAEKAETANMAKTTFLANMSHDIRTPMNAILGYNQLMKKEITDPKLLDYQEKIEKSGNLLLSIINNVLDMARIESGKEVVDENYLKVGGVIKEVCDVFEVAAKKKELYLTYEINVNHRDIVCDIVKVKEVLTNLVSNAIKYTPSGGTVRVQLNEIPCDKEGYVRFKTQVIDSGIGMSENYLPTLFDSFSRERNTTAGKIAGTGLGMAIVKGLVDLMGGSIEVESELGKGTTFTVIIDHKIADEAYYTKKQNGMTDDDMRELIQGKHILLAEDNELNAEIATAILEDAGVIVEHVEDGVKCVAKMEEMPAGTYDLILMDIQMPNMDGYKATQVIRHLQDKAKADIPIIAMTANAFEEDKKTALTNGMNGHIAKPIDLHKAEEVMCSVFKLDA